MTYTALSAPHPSINFIDAERLVFAEGLNEMMDYRKNELICFSDSAGTIMVITMDAVAPKADEIREVGRMFQKEVDRRRELDEWNEKYKIRFGSIGENNVDDYNLIENPATIPTSEISTAAQPGPTLTQEQIRRKICDETFK